MNGMEADGVDGVELLWVASCGPVFAVALEGEVEAANGRARERGQHDDEGGRAQG